MKLRQIISNYYIIEGSVSDVLIQTKPQRIESLIHPASLLKISPAVLNDELDKVLLRYNLEEYLPNSFWDRLATLCGTSMSDTSGLFRKSFDRAKSVKSNKLRYMQVISRSYEKAFQSLDFATNAQTLENIKHLVQQNISFFDTFIHLLDSYIPGLDR